jgi:endonuclease
MRQYNSIRQLVIDQTISNGKMPPYEALTQLVLEHFPNSKWKESHYAWYRSQINTGKIELTDLVERSDSVEEEIIEEQAVTEFAISIEKDLQIYLSNRLTEIEEGLTLVSREYKTDAGFIDILCKDKNGDYVIIETKAGKAKDAALGQILGYIGALKESGVTENIRGILVASDFDSRLFYAAKALANITLTKYNLSFRFDKVS